MPESPPHPPTSPPSHGPRGGGDPGPKPKPSTPRHEAPRGGGDLGASLSRKLGPLPLYAWVVVVVGAYFLWRHFHGQGALGGTAADTSGQGAGTFVPTGDQSGGGTGEAGSSGVGDQTVTVPVGAGGDTSTGSGTGTSGGTGDTTTAAAAPPPAASAATPQLGTSPYSTPTTTLTTTSVTPQGATGYGDTYTVQTPTSSKTVHEQVALQHGEETGARTYGAGVRRRGR